MNDIQRYLVEENVEDFDDGLITRRELLHKVTLIMGTSTAAIAALVAVGCNLDQQRGIGGPAATAAPTPAASPAATAASPGAQVAYATPPPAATTDGITVRADDPRITAAKADVKAADGATLIGYLARPKADGRYPGVVVIHENRGLLEHIRDVTRRVATAGMVGVAIDLLSRQGGADALGQNYGGALGNRPVAEMVRDLVAAMDHLKAQPFVDGNRLGAVGFCFGGGMTWSLVPSGASLRAAAPCYGPLPSDSAGLATTKTAVLGVYAERDTRVSQGMAAAEEQLKKAGVTYKLNLYPGTDHAFHNDSGARYVPEQAQRAWIDTIEWFKRHLA